MQDTTQEILIKLKSAGIQERYILLEDLIKSIKPEIKKEVLTEDVLSETLKLLKDWKSTWLTGVQDKEHAVQLLDNIYQQQLSDSNASALLRYNPTIRPDILELLHEFLTFITDDTSSNDSYTVIRNHFNHKVAVFQKEVNDVSDDLNEIVRQIFSWFHLGFETEFFGYRLTENAYAARFIAQYRPSKFFEIDSLIIPRKRFASAEAVHTLIETKNFSTEIDSGIKCELAMQMLEEQISTENALSYIRRENRSEAFRTAIERNYVRTIKIFLDSGNFIGNVSELDEMIQYAISIHAIEIQMILINYKAEKNWYQNPEDIINKKFEL